MNQISITNEGTNFPKITLNGVTIPKQIGWIMKTIAIEDPRVEATVRHYRTDKEEKIVIDHTDPAGPKGAVTKSKIYGEWNQHNEPPPPNGLSWSWVGQKLAQMERVDLPVHADVVVGGTVVGQVKGLARLQVAMLDSVVTKEGQVVAEIRVDTTAIARAVREAIRGLHWVVLDWSISEEMEMGLPENEYATP